jgi:hypothetical protein
MATAFHIPGEKFANKEESLNYWVHPIFYQIGEHNISETGQVSLLL